VRIGLAILSGLLFLCAVGRAQEQPQSLVQLYDGVIQASKAENLDKGIALCDRAIKEHSENAMKRYGPVFGYFFYMKGMLLIRKGEYQAAIGPLKRCYEEWDNSYLKEQVDRDNNANLLPNRFHLPSIVQWGNCLMKLENYGEAATKLEKALTESQDNQSSIDRLAVQMNLARCYILAGQREKGEEFLNRILDSEDLSSEAKREAFMILAWDWSRDAKYESVRSVVSKNGDVTMDDALFYRYERNRRFEALAAEAMQAGEPLRSLIWYSLMASPAEMVELYQDRKLQLNSRRELLEKDGKTDQIPQIDRLLESADQEIGAKRQDWARMLLGTGAAHYQLSSVAAARASYHELAEKFPGHKERPLVLHNLVVCNVNMERWKEAYHYGLKFFEEFPKHELKPNVAKVLVEVIFLQGQYQEAYDIATDVRPEMEVGSAIREIPDFVVGASAFHLGKFEQAEQELESYLKTYPDGQRLEPVRFYLANTKVNLMKWEEAGTLLEAFLVDYPDSPMRSATLFLSGLSHLVLEDLDLAETRIGELQNEFPNAAEIPASHNVMGDILATKSADYPQVKAQYIQAKHYVESEGRGSIDVAAYSLRQLIPAASEAEQWQEAADYYEEFMERYEDTGYKLDASLSVLDALVALDRREEGLKMLTDFVNAEADAGVSDDLDKLFGSYLDFLDKNYTTQEKVDNLEAYPFTNPANPPGALDAWLLMAKIETLEGVENPERYADHITQLFFRLEALYKRNGTDLSNYTLVRLARWSWEERGQEAEARKVYEFILHERGDATGDAMGYALVDLGKLELAAGTPELEQAAYEKFLKVIREVEKDELVEEATLNAARVLMKRENYQEAYEMWRQYLDDRTWTLARPEANYSLALCIDMQGRQAEALKLYVSVYVNYAGHLDWSTRAYLRTAVILRENDREADSLKVLQEMLQRMGHLEHPGIEKGKEVFFRWREEYVAKAKAEEGKEES